MILLWDMSEQDFFKFPLYAVQYGVTMNHNASHYYERLFGRDSGFINVN